MTTPNLTFWDEEFYPQALYGRVIGTPEGLLFRGMSKPNYKLMGDSEPISIYKGSSGPRFKVIFNGNV